MERFHGRGNGRERGEMWELGVNAACSRKIAALAVAMEMEGCPWPWGGVVVS